MMRKFFLFILLFISCTCTYAGTAVSVSGLYTTGINGAWITSTNASAYVVDNKVVNESYWLANSSSAKWISYNTSAQLPVSTYAYTLSFNVNGDGGTGATISNYVSITLTWTSDDTSVLYVNGKNTGYTESGWTTTKTITFDSTNTDFRIGPNTLSIFVNNSGGGPSGLMVTNTSYKILPATPVPERGTWIIVVLSAVWVIHMRFFKNRD